MSEVKTIKCLPHLFGTQNKALYNFSWPQLDSSLNIGIYLNYNELSIGTCKTAFYENCKEGDLVIAVDSGSETFGVNLEEGDLVMVYPENYDFEINSQGCLIMKETY